PGFVVVVVVCLSCNPMNEQIEFGDIPGRYVFHKFQQDLSYDSLVLFPDSTYSQMFLTSRGEVFRNTGTWSFRENSEVVFKDFRFFTDTGHQRGTGNWFAWVVRKREEIRIIYSSEDEEYYRRKLNLP